MLGATVVGLAPLALGLGLGSAWLAGLGAVTTCTLPIVTLRLLAHVLSRPR